MSQYENNIPTNDRVFEPMGPSDIPSPIADVLVPSPYADDDPARPVDDLVKGMPAQRPYLMTFLLVLEHGWDPVLKGQDAIEPGPKTTAELERVYLGMYRYHPIVFSPYDLLVLLEEKGAVERVNADGSPYDSAGAEPVLETGESGAVYYRAGEPDDLYWAITDAGRTIIEAELDEQSSENPVARAQAYLDEDEAWRPLYKRLLTLCEAGATIEELNDAISYDDLILHPREEDDARFYHDVYAAYFVDRMEKVEAIDWFFPQGPKGGQEAKWYLTRSADDGAGAPGTLRPFASLPGTGAKVLALLDDMADRYDADEQARNKERFLTMFEPEDPNDELIEFSGVLIDEDAIKAARVDESEEEGANYVDPPTRTDYIPAF